MRQDTDQVSRTSVRRRIQDDALSALKSLLLVGITTIALLILDQFFSLRHLSLIYLVPVVIAATNWGMVAALIAAIASGGTTVFFFYPPIYSFLVEDPQHLIELLLFGFVAIVTGLLATNLRRHADLARRRETEMRELYTFSRRLVAAHTTSDIYTAIREHLSSITGYRTILFEIVARGGGSATLHTEERAPEQVKRAAELLVEGHKGSDKGRVVGDGEGRVWLVRAISEKGGDFGVLAIDLGPQAGKITDTVTKRIDTILTDATATLERLDLAHALNDARVRSETEALRDALIGSVSHQLRTPLVSILGAATVISRAPGNSGDPRLASLADILRDEVDRLNNDVQDLLNAALISSKGVRLDREWIEPSDIINATVDRRQRLLSGHRVLLDVPDELPFIYGDPILLEQALGQIVDNAAKYSHPGSAITIAAKCDGDSVVLSIKDEGIGLVGEEPTRLWERFFRGGRQASNVSGSGLGLWIAKAFVTANGGEIEAFSEGADRGTLVSIRLQAKESATLDLAGSTMGSATILVIDDERHIRQFLRAALEFEGFTVQEACDAEEGIRSATLKPPDLIILDLGLPDRDGASIIERLRAWSNTPIIVLTIRSSEREKVRLLELGADDYVVKPFGISELIARARAMLRPRVATTSANDPVVRVGPLEINLATRSGTIDGKQLVLGPKEYLVLQILAQHAGKVVTRQQIMNEVWGGPHVDDTHYLRVVVRKLRKKIEVDPTRPRILLTELGIGYRLVVQ